MADESLRTADCSISEAALVADNVASGQEDHSKNAHDLTATTREQL